MWGVIILPRGAGVEMEGEEIEWWGRVVRVACVAGLGVQERFVWDDGVE